VGPVLDEDQVNLVHPHDDRIVDLSLRHQMDPDIGHDVTIDLWWAPDPPA
jgi:hypothetical protein